MCLAQKKKKKKRIWPNANYSFHSITGSLSWQTSSCHSARSCISQFIWKSNSLRGSNRDAVPVLHFRSLKCWQAAHYSAIGRWWGAVYVCVCIYISTARRGARREKTPPTDVKRQGWGGVHLFESFTRSLFSLTPVAWHQPSWAKGNDCEVTDVRHHSPYNTQTSVITHRITHKRPSPLTV